MRTVSADNVSIHYTIHGDGDTALIFVHGWSCDQTYWANQVQAFSGDYRIVTLDLAGHGQSGIERAEYTMEAFARDVVAVVNTVDTRVILIGHSMGGPIVITAASMLPDKVIGLIGIDTQHDLASFTPVEEIPDMILPFRTDFRNATYDFVTGMFSENARNEFVHTIAERMSSANPAIAVSALEYMMLYLAGDYRKLYKTVEFPRYFINGTEFRKSDAASAEHYGVRVKELNGSGHFPMLEDPNGFNSLLAATLSGITTASGRQEQ